MGIGPELLPTTLSSKGVEGEDLELDVVLMGEDGAEDVEDCVPFKADGSGGVVVVVAFTLLALLEVEKEDLAVSLLVLLTPLLPTLFPSEVALPSFLALNSGSKFSTSFTKAIIAASFVNPLQAFQASHFHFFFISLLGGDGVLQSPSVTCLFELTLR